MAFVKKPEFLPSEGFQRFATEWAPVASMNRASGDARGAVNAFTFSTQRRKMVVVKARMAVTLRCISTAWR